MSEEILPLIDFSKVKKKRRREEPDNDEQDDQEADMLLSVKKKNKKKKKKPEKAEINEENIENESSNNTNGLYAYDFLLNRLYNIMDKQKASNTGANWKIPALKLGKGANGRTTWVNFEDVAMVLGRQKEDILKFICAELSIDATLGGEGQMYFKTKQDISEKTLQSVINDYYKKYIRCPNCKSQNTILRKDPSTRLSQIYCKECKGVKTVQPIKARGGEEKRKKK